MINLRVFFIAVPPSVSYLSHFAYANRAWNGEGFDFGASPGTFGFLLLQIVFRLINFIVDYWLVDVSGFMHGITADRLGGSGSSDDIKGMLFAMTERNSGSAPSIWLFYPFLSVFFFCFCDDFFVLN